MCSFILVETKENNDVSLNVPFENILDRRRNAPLVQQCSRCTGHIPPGIISRLSSRSNKSISPLNGRGPPYPILSYPYPSRSLINSIHMGTMDRGTSL